MATGSVIEFPRLPQSGEFRSHGTGSSSWPREVSKLRQANEPKLASGKGDTFQIEACEISLHVDLVHSLDHNDIELARPLLVSVRRVAADNYLAQQSDTEVAASGDTLEEAARNLKHTIAEKLILYRQFSPERLGPALRRQLQLLTRATRRK